MEHTVRNPADYGLQRCSPRDLAGSDAAHNAAGLRAVFTGADRGPHRDAIVLNTALALELTGHVRDPLTAINAAAAALDRGDGARMLQRIAEFGATLRVPA